MAGVLLMDPRHAWAGDADIEISLSPNGSPTPGLAQRICKLESIFAGRPDSIYQYWSADVRHMTEHANYVRSGSRGETIYRKALGSRNRLKGYVLPSKAPDKLNHTHLCSRDSFCWFTCHASKASFGTATTRWALSYIRETCPRI